MPSILFSDPHIIGSTTGGAEVQLWILATGFFKSGWDVHYVTDMSVTDSVKEGVNLHGLANKENKQHLCLSIIGDINPDIIYQRGRKSHTGPVGKYAEDTRTPFIFATSMDIDCQYFKETGRLLHQPLGMTAKARLIRHRVRQDIASLAGMKKATLILAQSDLQKKLLKKNLSLQSTVFRNLHPVPDIDEIEKDDPPLILWLASVKQWKRPELFLELAESLKNTDFRFILAGRLADRELYEKMLIDYENKNARFEYIENIDLEQSNELIARASIFINTSLPYEGFPNTFIQSWLRKTVVFSLGIDPDDLISKLNIGKSSGDFGSMSVQITSLLNEPELLKEMGMNARKFSIKEFGFSENFGRIEIMARNLMVRKKGDKGIKEMLD